jgi:hypothetical protein
MFCLYAMKNIKCTIGWENIPTTIGGIILYVSALAKS